MRRFGDGPQIARNAENPRDWTITQLRLVGIAAAISSLAFRSG